MFGVVAKTLALPTFFTLINIIEMHAVENPTAVGRDFHLHNSAAELEFPFEPKGRGEAARKNRSKSVTEAIQRFPDLDSCLLHGQRPSNPFSVEKLKADWKAYRTVEQIDVCAFRVLTALQSAEAGMSWFESQGFQVSPLVRDALDRTPVRTKGGEPMAYSISMPARTFFGLVNWSKFAPGYWMAQTVSAGVVLENDGNPISVTFSINIE